MISKLFRTHGLLSSISNSTTSPRSGERLLRTIGSSLVGSAHLDSIGKILEDIDSRVPVNAGVCDGDTLLKGARTLCRHLLVALVDVGFDHDSHDASLALANLVGDGLGHLGLISVVLAGVS